MPLSVQGQSEAGDRPRILDTYIARTPQSHIAFDRACRVLPGGHTRVSATWTPYPIAVEKADGTHVWDLDGNRYIDMMYNYTALAHGHRYPDIVEAVHEQFDFGTAWSSTNQAQIGLAELLVERVNAIDQVVFVNSGTEAANTALAVARAVTGRRKILMARYGYHGAVAEFQSGTVDRPGPETLVATYNDIEDFRSVLDEHGSEICAVFLEPVMAAGGVIAGEHSFLHAVQQKTRECGALFVMDEVATFRLGVGGCHQEFGLDPDLVMFAKVIGGGFPVGAVGGKYELMSEFTAKNQRVTASGTFSGNPISMVAGSAAVSALTEERIRTMGDYAHRIVAALERKSAEIGLPMRITRAGDLFNFYLSAGRVSQMSHGQETMMGRFHQASLNNGVLFAPRGMACLATVWHDALVDEVIGRLTDALDAVARERA